jgi:hypothetical protein
MQTRIITGLCAAIALSSSLLGCAGGAQNTGVAVSQDAAAAATVTLSAADLATLKSTCAQVAPDLSRAASPTAPKPVSGTAVYPKAFCDQLAAGNTSVAQADSQVWLPKVLGALQVVAQVAGMALPLLALL